MSLIQRGTCAFTLKLAERRDGGRGRRDPLQRGRHRGPPNALFRSADPGYAIPAVLSSFAVGKELYNAFKAGQNPTVNLATNGVEVETLYPNVVAETKRGDRNHMVFAGAHLDSVPAGPGINDDGSGTAFQLELAEQLAKAGTPPRNKIRFLWFGGEEDGLVGSQYYAAHLSQAEVPRTDMMLDTDMIASPNFARLVYDGDGSTFGPSSPARRAPARSRRCFKRYWAKRGHGHEPIPFDGRSDYVGFINRGIPAGGVFAGAEAPKTAAQVAKYGGVEGEQLDPCYHEAATPTRRSRAAAGRTMNVYEADRPRRSRSSRRTSSTATRSSEAVGPALRRAPRRFRALTRSSACLCLPLVDAYQGNGLAALGDPTRRSIFERIAERPRARSASWRASCRSAALPCHSTKVLKDAGLVSDAEGTGRIYAVGHARGRRAARLPRAVLDRSLADFKAATNARERETRRSHEHCHRYGVTTSVVVDVPQARAFSVFTDEMAGGTPNHLLAKAPR